MKVDSLIPKNILSLAVSEDKLIVVLPPSVKAGDKLIVSAPEVSAIVTTSISVKELILNRSIVVAPPSEIARVFVPPRPVIVVSADHSLVELSKASDSIVKVLPEAISILEIFLAKAASVSL